MAIRYAITHLAANGLRTLMFANQGRNHYDTKEQADKALAEYVHVGDLRAKVLHDRAGTLEVRPVDCYEHGDAKGIYFPTNMQPVSTPPVFSCRCCCCNKAMQTDREEVYADLEGTPFKAYYCATCAAPALKLQAVRS